MSNLAKVLITGLIVTMVGVIFLLYAQISNAEHRAEMRAKVDERRIGECAREADDLRDQIVRLKQQLASAMQAPGTLQLDEALLALAPRPTGGGDDALGNIDQGKVVEVLRNGRPALQQCYERALKRNSALQAQQLRFTLGFTVDPSGRATGVSVRPTYDSALTDCVRSAVDRWKFPPPSRGSATIEAPITLSPKGS